MIRNGARGDGSIGQLLGRHYLWAWAARLVATDEQIAAAQQLHTEENLLSGGDELIFNGHKSFSTGGVASDLTVLEGILDGMQTHIFGIVPTKQDGIVFASDWN